MFKFKWKFKKKMGLVVKKVSWRKMHRDRKDGSSVEKKKLGEGHFSSRAQCEQRHRGGMHIQGPSKLDPYQREVIGRKVEGDWEEWQRQDHTRP